MMNHEYFDKETVTKVLHSALAYQKLKEFIVMRITTIPFEAHWTDVIS